MNVLTMASERKFNNEKCKERTVFGEYSRKISDTSISGCSTDSSNCSQEIFKRQTSLQDFGHIVNQKQSDLPIFKRLRSMSDGAVQTEGMSWKVFPSLPDTVLRKPGSNGQKSREIISEEELEQKFVSLSLAFTIDSATIKDRSERQRRYRDQTENNFLREVRNLREKLDLVKPLCTDFETAELLSILLIQVDIIVKAASYLSICAEGYGAVQYEERLTDAVTVMIDHVQLLKKQRDSARKQLQYTKRVLQQPDSPVSGSPTNPQKSLLNVTKLNRRRASIATLVRDPTKVSDVKRFSRKLSDLSLRACSLPRVLKSSRIDLNLDLVKIKEGFSDETVPEEHTFKPKFGDEQTLEEECVCTACSSEDEDENCTPRYKRNLPLREKMLYILNSLKRVAIKKYKEWSQDGTLHEIFCFCALLCFSFGIFSMVGILIEYEYAKRGITSSNTFFYCHDSSDNDENVNGCKHNYKYKF